MSDSKNESLNQGHINIYYDEYNGDGNEPSKNPESFLELFYINFNLCKKINNMIFFLEEKNFVKYKELKDEIIKHQYKYIIYKEIFDDWNKIFPKINGYPFFNKNLDYIKRLINFNINFDEKTKLFLTIESY